VDAASRDALVIVSGEGWPAAARSSLLSSASKPLAPSTAPRLIPDMGEGRKAGIRLGTGDRARQNKLDVIDAN
jgi:hypothetical protein